MRFVLLALCTLSLWCGAVSADEKNGAYLLNPGDVILVSVWREDDLKLEVRVLPDGSITFPLAGRVEVAGLDSSAVAQKIASKLEEYLPDPSVNVVVTDIQGNVLYVLGKVNKPGPVVMTGPTSVLQALSLSGGLDKFADKSSIQVVRGKGETQSILPIDYNDLISGQSMATNFVLQPGDTLVVP